ncbi:hypothetical protein K432DRAFT_424746 [Lepidopterella palustris CBS 459.81]|uniref:RING-type domain-containing protein n=1 Tax=Lepidopterella palustris CBS 459.81 TaxID=1314670 RepID=A0A8E2ECU6_9PEZI|nr:hypothetical protein K432DRAFT_424746 [Lepidopterella palustris CBS 459.81]
MSSNPPSVATSSKAATASGQLSPAQSQAGSVATGDNYGQRRSGGLGSFGAGAASRASPSPRNNQQARKQHKGSKRFRLADEDALAESAAMRSLNSQSRKGQTSITHLMTFSLPPRPQNHHHGYGPSRNNRRHPTWGLGSGYHSVDKARYVYSNYRFIVDPRGDYRAQSVNADVHLDWNNVLQILVSAQSQLGSCPICLGTPVAPRMAKCGHIFCLPCLIRYMHSEEEGKSDKKARSKKCPLCYDIIYISETRPVRWYTGQEIDAPREGEDIVLRLVMRPSGSTLALPRDGAEALAREEDIPWYYAAEVMDYARVMKGSEDYMMDQFEEEIRELERQEKEDELMFGEDNVEWVRKAVRIINEAKGKIKNIGNPPALPSKPIEPKPKRAPIAFYESNEHTPEMYLIQNASKSGPSFNSWSQNGTPAPEISEPSSTPDPNTNNASATNRKISNASGSDKPVHSALGASLAEFRNRQHHEHQTPSEYYFYQALLHYYLSPLDIRILKAAFGNFSYFPSTILPRVERVSTGHIVDDELRKKMKYLAHLPYGCEVGFLECDWTDTVAPEVLEHFKPEIEKRRKKNQDKEAREEKARIKAEKEEDARYAPARRKRPSISEGFTADDFRPLVSSDTLRDSVGSFDAETASTSPPWPSRRGEGFTTLASPSTSPSAPRTVWGTPMVPPTSPVIQAAQQENDLRDDGWLQGWEKDLLQEEDMIANAQAMSLEGPGEIPKKGASGGGKKKKAKKITLMSTNVRRGA